VKSQREAAQEIERHKQDASVVQYRLDTSDVKERLRRYLKGIKQKTFKDETGDIQTKWVVDEEDRKLNDRGIQEVMSKVNTFLDASFGQGNTDEEDYYEILADLNNSVKDDLFVNQEPYGLADEDYTPICNKIRRMARLYLSRTINDLEREHMKNSMTVNENQTVDKGSQGFMSKLLGG